MYISNIAIFLGQVGINKNLSVFSNTTNCILKGSSNFVCLKKFSLVCLFQNRANCFVIKRGIIICGALCKFQVVKTAENL